MTRSNEDWFPDAGDLKGWWEDFWEHRDLPFGGPSKNLFPIIAEEIQARAGNSISAIDIASGNGRYAVPMAQLGCTVTALEWTESGAERIRNIALSRGLQINIDKADYIKACIENRSYDLVVCSGLLEEIDPVHHHDVLVGFCRWTSPGGMATIKYCLELEGRGQLVEAGIAERVLLKEGMKIVSADEQHKMKISAATKMGSRTGTVIARQPK